MPNLVSSITPSSPLIESGGLVNWTWLKWLQGVGQAVNTLLAPISNPTFIGTVTQPAPSVFTAATTASSATAGAATALPATPVGYLEMTINGTIYKVPYYAL